SHPIVSTGPYRFLRHPSYTGVLLLVGGIGITLGNWLSLLIILAGVLIGLLYRISVEEKALRTFLGQPYEEYMRRTKRLIPFLF
ncbi:MAG: methyltransferase family protein, partial [Ktedonobacteraceae bacterium]